MHLKTQCPDKSFVVLEAKESFGGTWHTHTFHGIRSDSDLYTYGYRFKPWIGVPIATGAEILKYLGEVITENDLAPHIRYHHKIIEASWSSEVNQWLLVAERSDTGETCRFVAKFLWMCQGYYRHSEGYMPEWPGVESFQGTIVHSQTWPKDLDYSGKRVVIIGSGASAATLVPSMIDRAAHVTMLQRSPSYYFPARNAMPLYDELRSLKVDDHWTHEIVRRKTLLEQHMFQQMARHNPEAAKQFVFSMVRNYLPKDFPFEKHFVPAYRPWQQRLCWVPDGDLFKAFASGKASVVTDKIKRFTANAIELESGEVLPADLVVAATGLKLSGQGDIKMSIDNKPTRLADTVTYYGMMFTGVPNLLWVFGYWRQAWTLRVDLMGDFVCRLLKHMDRKGVSRVTPMLREQDKDMPLGPWVSPDSFGSGYIHRQTDLLPKSGNKPEWQHPQNYKKERELFPTLDLDNDILVYR